VDLAGDTEVWEAGVGKTFNQTSMAQEKKPMRAAWFSGGAAILVAFFIVGVTFPNTDRAISDTSVFPPRIYLQPQPFLACGIMAAAFVPALAIFLFGKRWFMVEAVGWIILAFLLCSLP
jgi:hypothetical protein